MARRPGYLQKLSIFLELCEGDHSIYFYFLIKFIMFMCNVINHYLPVVDDCSLLIFSFS